jgi:glycosyltransferase involved in cell wall biosynthesis
VYRLHQGLLRAGVESKMFVECRESADPSVVGFQYPNDPVTRVRRGVRRWFLRREMGKLSEGRSWNASLFSDDRSRHGAQILEQLPPWDILHLHWLSWMLDYSQFFQRLPQDRPIVWTLHDMNPFTGGCHFDGKCERFAESCGCCPQLNSKNPSDFSHRSWARKRSGYHLLKSGVLHLVTPSQWLAGEVRRSSLLGDREVTVIPYGLDTEIFKPRDCAASRDVFGLPRDLKVVLFLADWASETRKGLSLLVDALKGLPDLANLCLLILGNGSVELPDSVPNVRLDYVRNDRVLSMIYSAADVFVLPVLQDNLPNTALEAMACGLPVVAFATGGVPEMIRDGVEGRVVPPGDVAALRSAITATLQDQRCRALMSSNARNRAVREYGIELQAHRYKELYQRSKATHADTVLHW